MADTEDKSFIDEDEDIDIMMSEKRKDNNSQSVSQNVHQVHRAEDIRAVEPEKTVRPQAQNPVQRNINTNGANAPHAGEAARPQAQNPVQRSINTNAENVPHVGEAFPRQGAYHTGGTYYGARQNAGAQQYPSGRPIRRTSDVPPRANVGNPVMPGADRQNAAPGMSYGDRMRPQTAAAPHMNAGASSNAVPHTADPSRSMQYQNIPGQRIQRPQNVSPANDNPGYRAHHSTSPEARPTEPQRTSQRPAGVRPSAPNVRAEHPASRPQSPASGGDRKISSERQPRRENVYEGQPHRENMSHGIPRHAANDTRREHEDLISAFARSAKEEKNAFQDDDDVKIVGKRFRKSSENEETRITDSVGKITASDPKKTKAEKKDSKDTADGKNKEKDGGRFFVNGLVRAVVYLTVVSMIAIVLSIFIINIGNDVFAFVKTDEVVSVEIPEGATKDDIADILYENGVIKYKSVFSFYGKIKDIDDNFVAGTYEVNPTMNYKDLYYSFKEKAVSGTTWITVPEGYTVDEIIDLLLSYGIGGTKEDYVKAINEADYDYWFIDEIKDDPNRFYRLEGYLFPDTYEFYNASDAETVINKFLKRFSEVFNDGMKARAAELNMTTSDVVVLASMIEKEAGFSYDFRTVSSVFHNRLNNPSTFPCLSSDATVVYAIHHETGERPKHVTGEMMKYESPYNTYTNAGLPPGAIANPGMNALKYALYPADTNYFYFVSSDSGETLFATTQAEHDQNIASLGN